MSAGLSTAAIMRAASTTFSLSTRLGQRRSSPICTHWSLPSLADVDHIDAIWASLPQVWVHMDL